MSNHAEKFFDLVTARARLTATFCGAGLAWCVARIDTGGLTFGLGFGSVLLVVGFMLCIRVLAQAERYYLDQALSGQADAALHSVMAVRLVHLATFAFIFGMVQITDFLRYFR